MESEQEGEIDESGAPEEVLQPADDPPPTKKRFNLPFQIPPLRLIVLSCNIALSILAFVCTATLCRERKQVTWERDSEENKWHKHESAGHKYCDSSIKGAFRHVYIIWIVISLVEIVITAAVLGFYILVPKWKSKESFQITMSLYNLIQGLLHLYFWMLGTLDEDVGRTMKTGTGKITKIISTDAAVVAAVLFTQLNGCIYFSAIFFVREQNPQPSPYTNECQLESLGSSDGAVASPDIDVSGEQTVDTSEVQVST